MQIISKALALACLLVGFNVAAAQSQSLPVATASSTAPHSETTKIASVVQLPAVVFGTETTTLANTSPPNSLDSAGPDEHQSMPRLSQWAGGQFDGPAAPNLVSSQPAPGSQSIASQLPQPAQAQASILPMSNARNVVAQQASSKSPSPAQQTSGNTPSLLAQQATLDNRNKTASDDPGKSQDSQQLLAGGAGGADSGGGQVVPQPGPSTPASASTPPAPDPNAPAPVQSAPAVALRRALPAPYDPVFPSTEFLGVSGQLAIGVPDTDPVWPLEKAIYKECPWLQTARIKIYGWTNPGMDYSTSHQSNIPMSYSIVPNKPQLDQQIFRIERIPDTVQTEHCDWGFRSTILYGIDYRWTTAQGWYPASHELLHQNSLYGLDPVEQYGVFYVPKVAKGLVLKFGRFISPSDIEAQLAPDNYLWTHSLMFTYDNYTQTGLLASVKLCDHWTIQAGIHSGADIAPWAKAAIPTGEFNIHYIAPNNKDSIFLCMNSINNGKYRMRGQHDNLQEFTCDWSHAFTRRFHTITEAYWLYEFDDLKGGTVISPPNIPAFALTGAGVPVHGMAYTLGFVNYTNYAVSSRDYLSLRPLDFLIDPRGMRTGFNTWVSSWTLGWIHRFSDTTCIRPEIRYERVIAGQNPYDNGTRRHQFTVGFDVIQRF